jgi:hypothetical protein
MGIIAVIKLYVTYLMYVTYLICGTSKQWTIIPSINMCLQADNLTLILVSVHACKCIKRNIYRASLTVGCGDFTVRNGLYKACITMLNVIEVVWVLLTCHNPNRLPSARVQSFSSP